MRPTLEELAYKQEKDNAANDRLAIYIITGYCVLAAIVGVLFFYEGKPFDSDGYALLYLPGGVIVTCAWGLAMLHQSIDMRLRDRDMIAKVSVW